MWPSLALLLLITAAFASQDFDPQVEELGVTLGTGDISPVFGKLSAAVAPATHDHGKTHHHTEVMQLGESLGATEEAGAMTEAGVMMFKQKFIKLASNLKSENLRESALMMEQMSVQALKTRKGLDLIFRKLDELIEKTNAEEKADREENTDNSGTCEANLVKASTIISDASSKEEKNNIQMQEDHRSIMESKREWEASRIAEDKVQRENVVVMTEREDYKDASRDRIDERNKAIDVMVQATFIVCGSFKRFIQTEACQSIKARPDVNEPGQPVFPPSPSMELPVAWNPAADIEKDSISTTNYEVSQTEGWATLFTSDETLEGNENPENLPTHTVLKRGNKDNNEELRESKDEGELMLMEDDSVVEALSDSEKPALEKLKRLAMSGVDSRYTLPLTELGMALAAGETKKSKNIVEILLDVKGITEDEQLADKLDFVTMMDEYYTRTWDLKKLLNAEMRRQHALEADMEERRLRMAEVMRDTEETQKLVRSQAKIKKEEEDRCSLLNEDFAIRCAIRAEDLENIAKLISLLRTLYDKVEPKECKLGVGNPQEMCTHVDNGWCIWKDKDTMEQRCSCNVGYYSGSEETCEHLMCPGIGKTLFKSEESGVCSDRGSCNTKVGQCVCNEGFYHGPKGACDYKHCPASAGGTVDEQCSGHGTCDLVRGTCACEYEWSGANCEHKKCPNSNSVLYAYTSANACDGRGACDPSTGMCACKEPYKSATCELSDCPRNCMDRGGCDEKTGHCMCKEGFFGHACEFKRCPDECGNGGECNRHTGACICKDGYSGVKCKKSTRCSANDSAAPQMNWYTIWDKPGWLTCPIGQSMYALSRNKCEALDCIESGSCASPCEGEGDDGEVIKIRHCYHDLNVYGSMDKEGWSKCEANYFVGGFYRSGSSLYTLQMFKCCSYLESRWSQCEEANWNAAFSEAGEARVDDHKFIAGIHRNAGHTLRSIDKAYACGWVRGY